MALSLVFTILSFVALAWSPAMAVPAVPAIFVFGDSLVDVGNNNYLKSSTAKANFPRNGIDFPGGKPTGRFSNGYNTIDLLAKLLGYEQSPPTFLSLSNGAQIVQGVNFASGGSGILDTTNQGATITFTSQIADFKNIVEALVKQMGKKKTDDLLSKSLFFVSAGSNDMFANYLTLGSSNTAQSKQFIDTLVNKFSDHLKMLYGYGARKFAAMGIPRIGCVPAMRSNNPTGKCVEDLNTLASAFNIAAKDQMHQLELMLEGMKYSYGNVYDLMTQAIETPQMFGYKEVQSACCGSGNFNAGSPCTPNATLCSNRNQYLFWDQFHPTQATSKIIAMTLYSGSSRFATPVNVMSLTKY